MIDLIAFRNAGDRDGGEVYSPVLSSVEAALQRGRFEIDFNEQKVSVTLEVDYMPTIRQGDQLSATDRNTGSTAFGVVSGFSHVREGPALYTSVNLEVAA